MKVIPVLDVKRGLVVLARMGLRETYRPLRSLFCPFSSPVAMVKILADLGFKMAYMADLDAIVDGRLNPELYNALSSEISLMVDPGVRNIEDALKVTEAGVDKLILATETLPNLRIAEEALRLLGSEHVVLSLDLNNRRVLTRAPELRGLNPLECLARMAELGFKEAIVVDLARVGSFAGPDLELVRLFKPIQVRLIIGGGVRNIRDLLSLKREGVKAVLVASALHKSKLSIEELRRMSFI